MLKNIGKCSWTPHTQGAEENDSICLFPLFSLLQMKYILFVGENAASTDDIKMRQAIWTKNPTMMSWQAGTGFALKPGKKGLSDLQNLIQSR